MLLSEILDAAEADGVDTVGGDQGGTVFALATCVAGLTGYFSVDFLGLAPIVTRDIPDDGFAFPVII